MKTVRILRATLFAAAAMLAFAALGEHVMRLPAKGRKERIDNVRIEEPYSSGRLCFRAQNPKTKAVYSVYETPQAPAAALEEIAASMIAKGWAVVNETASLILFEAKNGKCAVAMAYEKDGATLAAILLQR